MLNKILGGFSTPTAGIGETLTEGLNAASGLLENFNEVIPKLEALGLSIDNLNIDTSSALPAFCCRISAALDNIDKEAVEELRHANSGNPILGVLLQGLESAIMFKDKLSNVAFSGIQADLVLGASPKFTFEFTK